MTKILFDLPSNEEGLASANTQLTAAQQATDDGVTTNNIARAALGDDVAGADALAAKSQIEFQRDTEFADLAQVQSAQQSLANDIQHQTMSRVENLFANNG